MFIRYQFNFFLFIISLFCPLSLFFLTISHLLCQPEQIEKNIISMKAKLKSMTWQKSGLGTRPGFLLLFFFFLTRRHLRASSPMRTFSRSEPSSARPSSPRDGFDESNLSPALRCLRTRAVSCGRLLPRCPSPFFFFFLLRFHILLLQRPEQLPVALGVPPLSAPGPPQWGAVQQEVSSRTTFTTSSIWPTLLVISHSVGRVDGEKKWVWTVLHFHFALSWEVEAGVNGGSDPRRGWSAVIH